MESLFRRDEPRRGAYLSRLFAFFSEELVRHWAGCGQAPYRDLGRPVIWNSGSTGYHVLDFTLERRTDGARFVTELKCEIEYEHYRYLTLTDQQQIAHHEHLAAFQKLLLSAIEPQAQRVTIGGKEVRVDGAILVWGIVTDAGRDSVMEHYGFADVLSIEAIVRDLQSWQPQAWAEWVQARRRWSDELFDWLAFPSPTEEASD